MGGLWSDRASRLASVVANSKTLDALAFAVLSLFPLVFRLRDSATEHRVIQTSRVVAMAKFSVGGRVHLGALPCARTRLHLPLVAPISATYGDFLLYRRCTEPGMELCFGECVVLWLDDCSHFSSIVLS